jgi:hypothetical protein
LRYALIPRSARSRGPSFVGSSSGMCRRARDSVAPHRALLLNASIETTAQHQAGPGPAATGRLPDGHPYGQSQGRGRSQTRCGRSAGRRGMS